MPVKSKPVVIRLICITVSLLGTGCATIRPPAQPIPNPIVVETSDFEVAWDAAVHGLDEILEIESEDRLAREIRTYPETSATIFEPWRRDTVGFEQRLESTLQTYRRYAIASVDPVAGGYAIKVEAYKQLEFLDRPERQTGGGASFPQDFPVSRSREIVGPIAAPLGWIDQGPDVLLEQRILRKIRDEVLGDTPKVRTIRPK